MVLVSIIAVGNRRPVIGGVTLIEAEGRWHDARDAVRAIVQEHGAAHRIRPRTHLAHPESVTEDDDSGSAQLLLLPPEPTAQLGRHAEHFEEPFGNSAPGDAFRLALASDRLLRKLRERHALENGVGGSPVAEVLLAHPYLATTHVYGCNADQPFGGGIR